MIFVEGENQTMSLVKVAMLIKSRCSLTILKLHCQSKGAIKYQDPMTTAYLTPASKYKNNSFSKYKIKIPNDKRAVLFIS